MEDERLTGIPRVRSMMRRCCSYNAKILWFASPTQVGKADIHAPNAWVRELLNVNGANEAITTASRQGQAMSCDGDGMNPKQKGTVRPFHFNSRESVLQQLPWHLIAVPQVMFASRYACRSC
ncbi:hypothetical protein JDV02_005066 [Purpureocillium takamizusanense]|uniref:Uncharacterized protein n=1 Tax=Purpureocillium takamizusanense TaxID=2060973 RepID=A0A9Q8QFN9_9HYPO|nr:uncharacterized protein JDV02_005066 [Purpureocillium takamizusanense]UNI18820.1 hypothetical protein JDV02_005066 [Purpureocillium takamizusanense]